jgi:dTDP-4-dehydrorhamnose 3,5-epimerase
MQRLTTNDLPLAGLKMIERQRLHDDRGFLSRLFCSMEMANAGWLKPIAQINHTYTKNKGTVRGLHYQQNPFVEMKLVTCIRGEIYDVVVDLRPASPTFLHWHGELLSDMNSRALIIPEGFAHGFQALSDDVELLYCHSALYNEIADSGLNIRDQRLSIMWPLEISEVSIRDQKHPLIDDNFIGVKI